MSTNGRADGLVCSRVHPLEKEEKSHAPQRGKRPVMIRLTNIPIFRRLFLAFFLAALLLNAIILFMSILYIGALRTHGITQGETSPFVFATMVAMIIATAGVTGLGYLMNLTITQPLTELALLTQRLLNGQTNVRASVLGRDEIAVVAGAINQMLDHIQHLVEQTQTQHHRLQTAAEQLVEQVTKIGDGDLTVQAEVNFESIGTLADVFNFIVEELGSLVGRVRVVAMGVERATLTTQREMVVLVTSADQQVSSIEETGLTIEEMAHACLQARERATHLNQAASFARQAASQGRGTVRQILRGVEQIREKTQESAHLIRLLEGRSQEIGEVIKLLDSLAHHTNRLALDAAIQAAMTSQAGTAQGFGEIAAEIRRMSEKAKEALTTVSQNMQGMRADIDTVSVAVADAAKEAETGTMQIQQTGQFFATIFGLVEEQASESEIIAKQMEHLYTSSGGVVETMARVSELTQASRERTRQAAQKMQELATQAQQLRLSVEVFKLKPDTSLVAPIPQREPSGTW
jgi:methyl-accepting chemotaxis protein